MLKTVTSIYKVSILSFYISVILVGSADVDKFVTNLK